MFCRYFCLISSTLLLTSICSQSALANVTPQENKTDLLNQVAQQPDINEDRFLQETPEFFPVEPNENQPVIPQPETEPPPVREETEESQVTIPISKIEVVGSTVFESEDFQNLTQPLEGRSVSLTELRNVAAAITQLYLEQGYITSRAVLVDQEIVEGIVQIKVFEGSLADIKIEGTERLNPGYIRRRIQLGTTTPLRVDKLEDQLRLLRTDPLLENVEASLRSGEEVGQSILVVQVKEANSFYGKVSVDNYSPVNLGSERLGVALGQRNLTGRGDSLAASYYRSTTGGSNLFDVSYLTPLNAKNGTLQLRTVLGDNKVTQPPFDVFDIEGSSELYDISLRQPLTRSPREEFALSVGFSFRDGKTLFLDDLPFPSIGADEDGETRVSVFRFGQDYLKRDVRGAWVLRSQFSIGTGLFDATTNDAPIPDSHFFSWLGQVQRVQRLNDNNLLIVQADLQLTPDSLLPSETFVLGGGQSLRGYRQNLLSGDNGFRFSIEDRITLESNEAGVAIFQLAPFLDMGAVWNDPNNPNDLEDETFLAGAGLGLLWEPEPKFNIRLDYALPLVDQAERGENAQDEGFYFSVSYRF